MESARQKRDQQLHQLVGDVREHKFPYAAPEGRAVDWTTYTEAQINEVGDTLRMIRQAVEQVPPQPPAAAKAGRPFRYIASDLAKVLLLQQYLGVSNRVCQGWACLFFEVLGLQQVPHYKAVERAYSYTRVRYVLDAVFELSHRSEQGHIEGLVLDGSGLPRTVKTNWESDKGTPGAKRELFDGSVTMLTVPHLLMTAHVPLAVGFAAECPTLRPLLEATVARHGRLNDTPVMADAAFLSRANCSLIADLGGVPVIFPKRGITLAPQGSKPWRGMLDAFIDDPQAWLEVYHQRSLAETSWSRHKHRNPRPLRRRLHHRRSTEKHTRFTKDNLTQLGYLHRMSKVQVPWFNAHPRH